MLFTKPLKTLLTISFLASLSACGGGEISSDNSSFGSPGATSAAGKWDLQANISVNAGKTTNNFKQKSTISVRPDGTATIITTDTDCAIKVNVNGSRINYETSCLVKSGDNTCTLTFSGFATISSDTASGSFTPRTAVCNNASASYIGNITGTALN